jgi:hypothetical protein
MPEVCLAGPATAGPMAGRGRTPPPAQLTEGPHEEARLATNLVSPPAGPVAASTLGHRRFLGAA